MTAAATPLSTFDAGTVHRAVLPNGLTVLVRRDPSAPVVAVVTYVKAGYFDETDDVVGIAHVLEHMFFKGTARRGVGEIAKETKASGGYLNAHTIYDHTSYYTVLPASGFAAGLDIQADAYANSVIDADELAKELEVIIQEAKRKSDNPSAVASETLYELLHDRHRMRRWRIGREPGLRALTREQLVAFYRNFYRPANTVLAIVGDVDPDEALARAERLYGWIPAGEPRRTPGPEEPARREFRYRELAGDVQQLQMVMGWRTVPLLHPDAPLLDLAAMVLATGRASRLYRAVRERQLASGVSAYNYSPVELGVFVVHAEGKPERAADAARAIWAQLEELRRSGAGDFEIERARRIYEARHVRRFESMEGQATHLASWEALGDWRLGDQYMERLLAATPADVTEAVRAHLDPDAAAVVVYRPDRAAPFAEDADALRRLLAAAPAEALPPSPARAAGAPAVVGLRPALERAEGHVRVYRTAGGVPILVRRKPGAPIAHVGIVALGGATEERPEEGGITALLARTAVKGTERRTATQIAEDGELLGGSVGASVGNESVGWSISVPTPRLAAAAELLADVAQHATVPEEALESERAAALAELAALRDDMFRYPMRLAQEAAFGAHPYGASTLGTEESLRAISAEAARRWHGERILRAPSVIAVVGEFDPDEVAAILARDFARLELAEPSPLAAPAWPPSPVAKVETRDKAQTALVLAFPGPGRNDDDRFVSHLVAGVASGLGGRFFDELRDRRSLAYTVHAYATQRRLAGTFLSYIATSPEKEEEARAGLLAEFARLREEPVSDDELARAQTYAIGTHAIRQESGAAVLGDLVDAWLFGGGLHELELHDERVRAVTPERMQALARRYLDESRRVEGIVRGVGRAV